MGQVSKREPPVLAEIRGAEGMEGIRRALRRIAEVRQLSRETIGWAAGLPDGYAAKVLAEKPLRHIGRHSLGPLLRVLGTKVLIVEDEDAYRRITSRLPKRDAKPVRSRASMKGKQAALLRKLGPLNAAKGGLARAKKLRDWRRRSIARLAARARWER